MYDVFKTMFDNKLPSVRYVIQIFCKKKEKNGELKTIILVILNLLEELREKIEETSSIRIANSVKLLKFNPLIMIKNLISVCPIILNSKFMVITNSEMCITFSEWYDFLKLCVSDYQEILITE